MRDFISLHPDFSASLRLLVERERYSLEDIGRMFGVTRQAIQQKCWKYGIVHPDTEHQRGMHAYRVWDDELNRFVPGPRTDSKRKIWEKNREVRKQERQEKRVVCRRLVVDSAVKLKETLGRDPTLREIYFALTGKDKKTSAAALLLNLWDSSDKKTKTTRDRYAEFTAALREAGVYARPRGRRGSIGFAKRVTTS